jgi:hypothetical protein
LLILGGSGRGGVKVVSRAGRRVTAPPAGGLCTDQSCQDKPRRPLLATPQP